MLSRVGGNNVVKNNSFQHKKCPKKKIVGEDLSKYKQIKDAIVEAMIEYGSPEAKARGLNWYFINSQINGLINKGFSYEDILYSFEMCIKRDKIFWGFGRVNKFIEQDVSLKNKYEEVKQSIVPVDEIKFNYKGGDELEW